MSRRFVITATDTNVGKTIFSAALVQALGASYWKPVQAGLDEETDTEVVARLTRHPRERGDPASSFSSGAEAKLDSRLRGNNKEGWIHSESYRLTLPASPHLAAEYDGIAIDPLTLDPPTTSGPLVIEGAGGALVPVTRDTLFADIFARWQIPVIVCARTGLGTINHTLMTIEALRHRDIPIHGIAFIGDAMPDSEAIIPALSGIRALGRLPRLDPLTSAALATAFAVHFDLGDFA
ncbi:ATP-dependent dethiobiotin synthetase BioD [Sphingobium boeckii]|uniref:ATP-dependent dethiobiotin synthetase BioD n=1 Tax=Sphingobium boeckii TaxID=1082345 RepID=A0A7W9AKQ9_9SPHN|nr:dethiobiotin synthase [Sphingobium boeckii]MBB5687475.1 dethiobiotin synthetase [Sphingobium boeckii]